MSKKITIYLKPTCTTCKKALSILKEKRADFNSIDYYRQSLTKKELTGLIKKLGVNPKDILRKRAGIYSELNLGEKELNISQIFDLILEHPDLLERPIVVCNGDVILARPAEKVRSFLSD